MPFVSSYLIDIFVGLLVCIVYTLFLVQLVEKLRTYLATKRSGWARNRYIKIFIAAVRGEAAAFDTVVLASLILMLSLLMVLWIWSSATEVEETVGASRINLMCSPRYVVTKKLKSHRTKGRLWTPKFNVRFLS